MTGAVMRNLTFVSSWSNQVASLLVLIVFAHVFLRGEMIFIVDFSAEIVNDLYFDLLLPKFGSFAHDET
jgi:hypothetical protein